MTQGGVSSHVRGPHVIDHGYSLAQHQLLLGTCQPSCQWRAGGHHHWHEECACGVEYVLGHGTDPTDHTLEILSVMDRSDLGF